MGYSELQCAQPVIRNALGKLSYDGSLRALDDRRRRVQNLVEAAAASFGSGSPANSRQLGDHSHESQAEGKKDAQGRGGGRRDNLAFEGGGK
jgi:hypothetical protein